MRGKNLVKDGTPPIGNRDLAARLAAANRMLEVAAAIGNEKPSVESILETFYESFRDLVPYDRMEYARVDGNTLETVWVRTEYEPVVLTPGFTYRRPDAGGFGEQHDPYIQLPPADRAAEIPEGNPVRLLVDEGVRSAMSCPLVEGGTATGFLFFCSREADAYDAFHLWVMTRIAAVAAGAIANGRLGDELERRNDELQRLDTLRSRYLATISHELRTPLTSVVGLSATLRDEVDSLDPEEVSELAGILAEQAADLSAIVEDLLVVARADAGDELPVANRPIDLRGEADEVSKSLGMAVEIDGEATALGDPGRVRQVLRNLLTNARRHGGSDVAIHVATSEGTAEVAVSDDGDGVAPEIIDSLFRPFAHSRGNPQSIGLGLWVSNHLAELMGGDLAYDRVDGRTVFRLKLPVAP